MLTCWTSEHADALLTRAGAASCGYNWSAVACWTKMRTQHRELRHANIYWLPAIKEPSGGRTSGGRPRPASKRQTTYLGNTTYTSAILSPSCVGSVRVAAAGPPFAPRFAHPSTLQRGGGQVRRGRPQARRCTTSLCAMMSWYLRPCSRMTRGMLPSSSTSKSAARAALSASALRRGAPSW